jgi:hypothetical protein
MIEWLAFAIPVTVFMVTDELVAVIEITVATLSAEVATYSHHDFRAKETIDQEWSSRSEWPRQIDRRRASLIKMTYAATQTKVCDAFE